MTGPRLLLEEWLPIEELGIESRRERAAASALPPLYFLHVWWARRPLVASRAAVLGSLLPAWSAALQGDGPGLFASEDAYHTWFLRLCGVLGDPVRASRMLAAANDRGERVKGGYGYPQAYKNNPEPSALAELHQVIRATWGGRPLVLDPTAGGGSIPFETMRVGFDARANDLNGVAAAILTTSLSVPAEFGPSLTDDLRRWGGELVGSIASRVEPFFPLDDRHEQVLAYIFARAVSCPRTGKPIPLAPSWTLAKGDSAVAVRLITHRDGQPLDRPSYEIARGAEIDFDPDRGTMSGGDAISPWDGLAVSSEYIRAEAKAGRMSSDLLAVAVRAGGRRGFRAPTANDIEGIALAEAESSANRERWLLDEVIPDDQFPPGNDMRPLEYGMPKWIDMFSPRQLLVQAVFVEEFRRLEAELRAELPPGRAAAVLAVLGLMQGKALNYNSLLASWHAPRGVVRSVFDRHDFAFKWTYAEFDGSRSLFQWCLDQLLDSYAGICKLLVPATPLGPVAEWPIPGAIEVSAANAASLSDIDTGSIHAVVMDPPYYDNVMYAELSDYFYVWEKETIGRLLPALFPGDLADKRNEAVANVARFADAGRRREELADADYQAKMAAIFDECRRVLRDDGVLTVMFTHKRAEAWDTLGMGLLQAGFRIETSWPVNTESESSLHQANKNAASSTIFLVCRKRPTVAGQPPFFEDLEGQVRSAVRQAVDRFSAAGLSGVDLLLSTYGPALSVISSNWPVYSSDADPLTGRSRLLRPEEALDAARSEVVRMQRRRLVGTDVQFDAYTDFELIAWETFKAAEFPFDEARRLALATGGLDVDDLARARLVEKKAGTVVLLPPERRLRRGSDDELPGVRPDEVSFPISIDAVHTVMYVAETDGLPAARALIDRAGLATDQRFLACLQGLVNAIPRTRTKAGWARKEAETLDRLCAAYFPGIAMPRAQEAVENLGLWT